jgi:hypothetical protein
MLFCAAKLHREAHEAHEVRQDLFIFLFFVIFVSSVVSSFPDLLPAFCGAAWRLLNRKYHRRDMERREA